MATKKHKKLVRVSHKKPKSFKITKEKVPFVTYQITEQTILWIVLLVYIMALSIWILNIQMDTLRIIEKINV
jgi:hypothetical protein